MRTIVSTAVGCLVASLAFAAFDASATACATTLAAPSGADFAITRDATPIVVARNGADDPKGDDRGGRGPGHRLLVRNGADDPRGDDRGGHGPGHRLLARNGADDPKGDDRGGHGPRHA